MEDFKNKQFIIKEELYDKIFKKDKLNIIYSEPGQGVGFICKNIIKHLALKEDFNIIETHDTESVNSTLRDLCDDVYALKRLRTRTGHKLEKPILYYVDITNLNNARFIDNIQRLYDTKIIQDLNIWVLFKTTKEFYIKDTARYNTINFSNIKLKNNITYIRNFPELNYIKLYENDKLDNVELDINNSLDFLYNNDIPIHKNIINCVDIINDCCTLTSNLTIATNLLRCRDFLSKVSKKLKEDYEKASNL